MGDHFYLRCKNCNYLTEIVGENHTWCFNCTRQFEMYFKLWKKKHSKDLMSYQKEMCESFSDYEIKTYVEPQNRKVEIRNPTKSQKVRRNYIKEGVPLDRGGHTEWDSTQIKRYYIPFLVLLLFLILVMILLEK